MNIILAIENVNKFIINKGINKNDLNNLELLLSIDYIIKNNYLNKVKLNENNKLVFK
jgi:hypothetical protein